MPFFRSECWGTSNRFLETGLRIAKDPLYSIPTVTPDWRLPLIFSF